MPSAKVLEQKKQQVSMISEKIGASLAGVLVDFSGTTVADDTKLRADLRKNDVYYAVVKNTLLRRAFAGTGLESLSEVLEGTTAIAISATDYVAPAKILLESADKYKKMEIKCGMIEGSYITVDGVKELATLPPKE